MKRKQLLLIASMSLLLLISRAAAQTTAFTYQGKLTDSGNLANASYDMQFKLFDAATNGTQIGATLTFDGSGTNPPAVSVTNGIFAVTLDFGTCSPSTPCFNGSPRFLEIAVKPHGSGSYTTLTPHQPITATPYAMKTANLTFNGAFNSGTTIFTASNTFAGDGAGLNTTPDVSLTSSIGKFNAFFGAGAGQANTTGSGNSFFGRSAGRDNVTGSGNSFFGTSAGQSNATGNSNAFFGSAAGAANFSGINNAFFGNSAGLSNTSGTGNTFIGRGTDFTSVNPTGDNNTLLGSAATVTSGVSNGTAIGSGAQVTQSNALVLGSINGVNGATADTNVGIGTTAPTERLHVNGNGLFSGNLTVNGTLTASLPTGSPNYIQNTTSPQAASNFNISGTGTADILNATTQFNLGSFRVLSAAGSNNLFAGINSGTTGNDNAFFGFLAGSANTSGHHNAFFGSQAGQMNTTGLFNAFFGAAAGQANTTGNFNAFFGEAAGFLNTTGHDNAFFGRAAGSASNSGFQNSFFGSSAGFNSATGNNNTFFGYFAGLSNTTGNNNTIIGANADVGNTNLSNATTIGFRALVEQNNSLILGSINGVNSATADTKVGIGTTTPGALLDVQRDGATIPETARFTTYGTGNEILSRVAGGTRALPTATLNGTNLLVLGATGHDGTTFVTNPAASINMDVAQAWTTTAQGTQIRFRTTPNGGTAASAIATRMIITNDGNVGISTSAPENRLHVAGAIQSTGARTVTPAGNAVTLSSESTFDALQSWANHPLALNGIGNNVGIGTTAPSDKLHVSGDIRVGTGTTGCVKDANGTVIAGACSSDARLKRNITPFPHLLDKLVQLQPVQFYWRSEEFKERHFGSSKSFGLIAQEVEKVLPELVSEDVQGYKAVNYSKLPLLSLQAIKELKAENDTLKQKLSEQQAQFALQQQQLSQQQQQLTQQQQEMEAIKKLLCVAQSQADLCKVKSVK